MSLTVVNSGDSPQPDQHDDAPASVSEVFQALQWFASREWDRIAHHPSIAKELTRRSVDASLLLERLTILGNQK